MKFIFILCFILFATSMKGQNLKEHKWKSRVLLIICKDTTSANFKNQTDLLTPLKKELKERKLIVYTILPKKYKTESPKNKFWITGSELYKKYNSEKETFKILLIGLDGSIKLKQNKVLKSEVLLSTIDGMPMRKQELKDRNK